MMLNPETVQFFEFKPISKSAAEAAFLDALWATEAKDVPKEERSKYYRDGVDPFAATAHLTIDAVARVGAHFNRFRVKADNKLGMKTTTEFVCITATKKCQCFNNDGIGQL
jgi:hypothetical protein